jgi:hypothetical protein
MTSGFVFGSAFMALAPATKPKLEVFYRRT